MSANSTRMNTTKSTAAMSQAPTTTAPDDDDMPAEIDFSNGVRGKFYRPNLRLLLPVYLDEQTQNTLIKLAQAKGVDYGQLVNDLLKKDLELIEMAR